MKFIRHTQKTLSTPAYSRTVAVTALSELPKNPQINLIICKVFSAFMFEGVLSYIGLVLDKEWLNKPEDSREQIPDRLSIVKKNLYIIKLLGIETEAESFPTLPSIISKLMAFRHSFAHPKVLEGNVQSEGDPNVLFPMPPLDWQNELNREETEKEYIELEKYCNFLSEKAAEYINKLVAEFGGWKVSENYLPSHSRDYEEIAGRLPLLLYSQDFGISSYERVEEA